MEVRDEYVIKFNCDNLDPETVEVKEGNAKTIFESKELCTQFDKYDNLQLLKIGKESLLVCGSDDKGCEVYNYAEFNEFFNVLQFQDLFKSVTTIEFSVPKDYGFKFKITGLNFKDKKEVSFGFVPIYSEQNGFYDPCVEVFKIDENDKVTEGPFDGRGKE